MQLNKVSISSCPTLNDFAMVHAKIVGNDMNLNSAVSLYIEMLSAVFGGAFACIFFNCGAVRLSHARTL